MNALERFLYALNLKEPDYVPIGEFVIDEKVIRGFGKGYRDSVDFALGEGLSFVSTFPVFKTIRTLANGNYVDEWGCTYSAGNEVFSFPIKGPIVSRQDLKNLNLPKPDCPHRLGLLPAIVERVKGKLAINFHYRVAFMWSVYLMGMENFLSTMVLDPDFIHRILSKVADVNIEIIKHAIRAGADTISVHDDYCSSTGPLMSPKMFREFIFPHLKRAVSVIHDAGLKCIKHTDGNIWPIFQDMVDSGIDAINPLEPIAHMDIGEVKRKYGDRLCLMGNIDCGDLLSHGTKQQVACAVRECIRVAAPGGGFILTSSNSIHSGVKPDNYSSMINAAHKYGKYPIDV